jgi:hypothetical protein
MLLVDWAPEHPPGRAFKIAILASWLRVSPLYSSPSHGGGGSYARVFFHPFGAPIELERSHVMEDRHQSDDHMGEGDVSMGWESRVGPMFSS